MLFDRHKVPACRATEVHSTYCYVLLQVQSKSEPELDPTPNLNHTKTPNMIPIMYSP